MRYCLSLLFVFAICDVFSQCKQDFDHNVIINEVGSYVSRNNETGGHINDEFIELLVVGNPAKPFSKVNLSGLIIDDNNMSGFGIGNQPGHIRISDDFPDVDPGSLILIYNSESTNFDFIEDGTPNSEGVYKVALSSPHIRKIPSFPNQSNSNYPDYNYTDNEAKWDYYVPFRNFGDVAQIRTPEGNLIHALGWYNPEEEQIDMPASTIIFEGSLTNEAIKFVGENPLKKSDFNKNKAQTPGSPNNAINENFINNIKGGIVSSITISLDLISGQTTEEPNGKFKYTVSNFNPDTQLEVMLNGELQPVNQNGTYYVGNLQAGLYEVTVVDGSENCSISESLVIPLELNTEQNICSGNCVTLSAYNQGVDNGLIESSPCLSWLDEGGNILGYGSEITVCPTESTTITQYIENASELTEVIIEHHVEISNFSISATPIDQGECVINGYSLQVLGNNIESILWSTSEVIPSIEVYKPGTYTADIIDVYGCASQLTITLSSDDFQSNDTDGDGVCDYEDCYPNNSTLSFSVGDACDDNNISTINDVINAECQCVGEPDENNPCNGNDTDGDGICDDEDEDPNDPCFPNGQDSDGDGICDSVDCSPEDNSSSIAIGDSCDDNNASTINDIVHSDCICRGTNDPSNPCDGNDIDGDGICDDEDDYPNDSCNNLSIEIDGTLTYCFNDDASLSAVVNGGIGPYTIVWSNGINGSMTDINTYISSSYSVSVTDAAGCTIDKTVDVTIIPEMFITLLPETIGICPNATSPIEVLCREDYDSYLWESDGQPSQTTREAKIVSPGEWTLTVTKEVNGVMCNSTHSFMVYDLSDPDDIESYLLDQGFYSVPISFDPLPGLTNSTSTRNSCSSTSDFRFNGPDENSFNFISFEETRAIILDVINTFKVLDDYSGLKGEILSENECLCSNDGPLSFEEEFESNEVSLWFHQFKAGSGDLSGKLFLKAKFPNASSILDHISPINEDHKSYLSGVKHEEIIAQGTNATTHDHVAVLARNLFMTKPFTGFAQIESCEYNLGENQEPMFISPAGVTVELEDGITDLAFSKESDILDDGMLIYYKEGAIAYRSYYFSDFLHAGYYSDAIGEFEEDFSITNNANGVLTVNMPNTCTSTCNLYNTDYSVGTENDNTTAGYGLAIKPSLEPLYRQAEINAFVQDLICSIKNRHNLQGSSVFIPTKYHDKILLATDIYIGSKYYPYLGLRVKRQSSGSEYFAIEEIAISENSPNQGVFENAIATDGDNFLRICALIDESWIFSPNNSIYDINVTSICLSPVHESITEQPTLGSNQDLYVYLDNDPQVGNENLLLFVNGYRNNMAPANATTFWNSDYLRKPYLSVSNPVVPPISLSSCSGYYSESGGYWGDTGRMFAERISTTNIYYFDGHDNITTSNHNETGIVNGDREIIKKAKLNFASSMLSSFRANNKHQLPEWINEAISLGITYQPTLPFSYVKLNNKENLPGFMRRYNNGVADAEHFWTDMSTANPNRSVFVKMNGDNQITGKIDIVAHSMGYAHAMGMISVLKQHLAPGNKIGRLYILAPENSCIIGEGMNVDDYEEVWQYGSSPKNPYLWEVDGVAVQCQDFDNMPDFNTIYLEDYPDVTEAYRNFLDAHYIKNYGWIFSEIQEGIKGYVKSRN